MDSQYFTIVAVRIDSCIDLFVQKGAIVELPKQVPLWLVLANIDPQMTSKQVKQGLEETLKLTKYEHSIEPMKIHILTIKDPKQLPI